MPKGQGEGLKVPVVRGLLSTSVRTEFFRWLDTAHTVTCGGRGVRIVMNADVEREKIKNGAHITE